MFDETLSNTNDPIFLRHDLMVELGRLEMAIEEVCSHRGTDANNQASLKVLVSLESLQAKHAQIATALSKLAQTH